MWTVREAGRFLFFEMFALEKTHFSFHPSNYQKFDIGIHFDFYESDYLVHFFYITSKKDSIVC